MRQRRLWLSVLIWTVLVGAITAPVALAAGSPFLAWRDPVYIIAGFSGIIAMALLLLQPLMAGSMLPGLTVRRARQMHRWIGGALLAAVLVHVAGLWITSPPDVVDALLFVSPTPFSAWGVVAMWAVIATAVLALTRRRFGLRPRIWRRAHTALAIIIVTGSVIHAVQIEGTMEPVSRAVLCLLVVAATVWVVTGVWRRGA